jgi:hypothetical protein
VPQLLGTKVGRCKIRERRMIGVRRTVRKDDVLAAKEMRNTEPKYRIRGVVRRADRGAHDSVLPSKQRESRCRSDVVPFGGFFFFECESILDSAV